jgi:hypothetical protein
MQFNFLRAWKAGEFAFGRFDGEWGSLVVKLMLDEEISFFEGRLADPGAPDFVVIGRCNKEGKVAEHEWAGKAPAREIRSKHLASVECGLMYMRRHRVDLERDHLTDRLEGAESP